MFNGILNSIFLHTSFRRVFKSSDKAIAYNFHMNDYDVDLERFDSTAYSCSSTEKGLYFSTLSAKYILYYGLEGAGEDIFYFCNCKGENQGSCLLEAIRIDFLEGEIYEHLAKIAENVGKGVERVGEYFDIKWSSNLKICKVYAKSFGIDFEKSVLLVAKEEGITIKINPNDSDICFSYLAD